MFNVLVCDDDRDIVSALKIYLTAEGYNVLCAYNGQEAIDAVKENEVHLILMDIMMPGVDGMQALMKIRETQNMPVIFTTAKSEDNDIILGLNLGADDYVTKPFNPVELMARVRSQLRRYTKLGSKQASNVITVGSIEIDDGAKAVTVDGESVSLTPTEYEILKLLALSPGAHQAPEGKNRDRPRQAAFYQSGMGPGLQDRKMIPLFRTIFREKSL